MIFCFYLLLLYVSFHEAFVLDCQLWSGDVSLCCHSDGGVLHMFNQRTVTPPVPKIHNKKHLLFHLGTLTTVGHIEQSGYLFFLFFQNSFLVLKFAWLLMQTFTHLSCRFVKPSG